MKGYVEQYLNEHPVELDESLTDSKKAAPANLVGQLKENIADLPFRLEKSKKRI